MIGGLYLHNFMQNVCDQEVIRGGGLWANNLASDLVEVLACFVCIICVRKDYLSVSSHINCIDAQ